MSHNADNPKTPWAYVGTDDTVDADNQFPLSPNNSWAAIVVWLTMIVNPDMLQADLDTQQIADTVGITKPSVDYIRKMATKDPTTANAFMLVSKSFGLIGKLAAGGGGGYPPPECMTFGVLLQQMAWVKNIAPIQPPPHP